MPYRLEYKNRALKDLRGLSAVDARRVLEAIQVLSEDPRPIGSRKLTNESEYRRLRVGKYRIKYAVADEERVVTIARVGVRGEAYRKRFRGG